MLSLSLTEKMQQVIDFFKDATSEVKYEKIIELGKKLPRLSSEQKTNANLIQGCQSTMYLYSTFKDGRIYFIADSDALISFGLAALLINVYSGETPETVLTCPPSYLVSLGIASSLSPSRSNGLHSIHLRMKQDALLYIVAQEKAKND